MMVTHRHHRCWVYLCFLNAAKRKENIFDNIFGIKIPGLKLVLKFLIFTFSLGFLLHDFLFFLGTKNVSTLHTR